MPINAPELHASKMITLVPRMPSKAAFQLRGGDAVFGLSVAEQKQRLLPAGRIIYPVRGQVEIAHVIFPGRAERLLNQSGQLLDRGHRLGGTMMARKGLSAP